MMIGFLISYYLDGDTPREDDRKFRDLKKQKQSVSPNKKVKVH